MPRLRELLRFLAAQWMLLLAISLYLWAFTVSPERAAAAATVSVRSFVSVLLLVLAVMGLVGLIQVWVSRDFVARLLGREAGVKALLIAAVCGMVLIGPAYIIFPLLMSLRLQGARWAVVVIVLASYTVKLHMIPLEVGYLGWQFSMLRIFLTLSFAVPLGLFVEACMEWRRPGAS